LCIIEKDNAAIISAHPAIVEVLSIFHMAGANFCAQSQSDDAFAFNTSEESSLCHRAVPLIRIVTPSSVFPRAKEKDTPSRQRRSHI